MNESSGSNDLIAFLLIAFAIGMMFIGGCAIHYGRKISSKRIPMQWGADGKPIWFAPRLLGIWFSFYFTLIVSAFLFILAFHEAIEKLPSLGVAMAIVVATNVAAQMYHLRRVLRWELGATKRQGAPVT
jgi:MFS family permease